LAHIAGTTLAKGKAKGAVKIDTKELPKAILLPNVDTRLRSATQSHRRTNKPDVVGDSAEKKQIKRGEHVINNNVMKVFRNLIEAFLQGQGTTMKTILGVMIGDALLNAGVDRDRLEREGSVRSRMFGSGMNREAMARDPLVRAEMVRSKIIIGIMVNTDMIKPGMVNAAMCDPVTFGAAELLFNKRVIRA